MVKRWWNISYEEYISENNENNYLAFSIISRNAGCVL